MRQFFLIFVLLLVVSGCNDLQSVQSVSGVQMAKVGKVKTDAEGLTVEQRNIKQRIDMDNSPGSIKHLYVISAYSGQVLIYSTVDGKVTSSGKRLTPQHVTGVGFNRSGQTHYLPQVQIGSTNYETDEILGEDGTFGDSVPYLYWWNAQGVYHQHYVTGGEILHISDQPLAVGSVVINMEVAPERNSSE